MRLRQVLRDLRHRRRPIRLGSLGKTHPVSWRWGYDRGQPVDRWYIERFMAEHRADITGRVIEVKEGLYTDRFGHDVTERAVLDVDPSNEEATHIADLAAADQLPGSAFDCFVLTQTLQLIFDLRGAIHHAHRILRPGGVLLVTLPVASRIVHPPYTDYWRFTPLAVERLLRDGFREGDVMVEGRGNVLSQTAFLNGLAAEDLSERQLMTNAPDFPLVVCARAVRAA